MAYQIKNNKPKKKLSEAYGIHRSSDFLLDDDGTKADNYYFKLLNKGYKPLYKNAPYQWAVFNPKEQIIITYSEGDINKVEAYNKSEFDSELYKMENFWKENDKKIYGDIRYNLEEYKRQ